MCLSFSLLHNHDLGALLNRKFLFPFCFFTTSNIYTSYFFQLLEFFFHFVCFRLLCFNGSLYSIRICIAFESASPWTLYSTSRPVLSVDVTHNVTINQLRDQINWLKLCRFRLNLSRLYTNKVKIWSNFKCELNLKLIDISEKWRKSNRRIWTTTGEKSIDIINKSLAASAWVWLQFRFHRVMKLMNSFNGAYCVHTYIYMYIFTFAHSSIRKMSENKYRRVSNLRP